MKRLFLLLLCLLWVTNCTQICKSTKEWYEVIDDLTDRIEALENQLKQACPSLIPYEYSPTEGYTYLTTEIYEEQMQECRKWQIWEMTGSLGRQLTQARFDQIWQELRELRAKLNP